jgi:hypothetical protein
MRKNPEAGVEALVYADNCRGLCGKLLGFEGAVQTQCVSGESFDDVKTGRGVRVSTAREQDVLFAKL